MIVAPRGHVAEAGSVNPRQDVLRVKLTAPIEKVSITYSYDVL
ncbi:MAG: hypothetical protein ABSF23_05875 [Terracidiphilus sp.]|jgi:hypothetical protein